MRPPELFRAIEDHLGLHLIEPRMQCQARAEIIGRFLQTNATEAGRLWILPIEENGKIASPLRDENDRPFSSVAKRLDEHRRAFLACDVSKLLEWEFHVAACAISDWFNPVIYCPVLFSGPTTLPRLMSIFGSSAKFIQTAWHTPPIGREFGSTYAPGRRASLFEENASRAVADLSNLKILSPNGVAYKRFAPGWRDPPTLFNPR